MWESTTFCLEDFDAEIEQVMDFYSITVSSRISSVYLKLKVLVCIDYYRGFNDAVNSFADDGWSLLGSDGVDDVTIAVDSSSNRIIGSHSNSSAMFSTIGSGILCAKASMLLQV